VVPVRVNAVVTKDPMGRKLIRAIVVDVAREAAFRQALNDEIRLQYGTDEKIGNSRAWQGVLEKIQLVAPTNSLVLIRGETGTGKSLVARAIHQHSTRRTRPLIKLNCAGLQAASAETELFGHEKGAFSGANKLRRGRLEHAHNGTLFLNDIGDLPQEVQPMLLHVLQDGLFQRLGSEREIPVDVRLLVTAHHDLEQMVSEGLFREDLYYQLNVFPIQVPPLRERTEDIPALARLAVQRAATTTGAMPSEITDAALERLTGYEWPGNIRELDNVMERATILGRGGKIKYEHILLGPELGNPVIERAHSRPRGMHEAEKRHIKEILERTNWKIEGRNGAAHALELKPSTLRARMKKLGIERPSSKKTAH
jgi:transcriptional regulator with GAF, ATPase, and Fis domain